MARIWLNNLQTIEGNGTNVTMSPIITSTIQVETIDMGQGATGANEVSIKSSLITGAIEINSPVIIDNKIATVSKLTIDENYT
jgi:hypothetical protein